MILFDLFLSFVKIGFTSFGGLSMVPLITSEMLNHQWMTAGEVSDIVAIAEMTPGPLGMNCATFAGMRTAGILGAIAANLGIMMPTLTLCVAAAVFFDRFRKSRRMQQILTGVRPACAGMMIGVMVSLSMSNYFPSGSIDIPSICISLLDFLLLIKWKKSVPFVISTNALLGLIFFGIL